MANALYNIIFKRSSTFAVAIVAATFLFERSFNLITDDIFEKMNKGRLFKDMKKV